MDITDISKVASRKRMNTDAEKLREKVSRETAKIIKLKVAQDTAYWDLKERLQQLEGAHERLQQNMVDVQMQHEAASAHYTRELRLRPDTLNKLGSTRDICDVLEDYGARLRRSVTRCRSDRAALGAAYAQCGARVRRLANELERARQHAATQRDKARRATEQQSADAERLAHALEQLGGARATVRELEAARQELAARVSRADDAAAAMRDDVARLVHQFDAQTTEMKRTIARHENEVAERARAVESLRAAERSARERAACLQRELSDELNCLRDQLAEASNTIDHLKNEKATYIGEINDLKKVIDDKSQHEKDVELKISSLKQYLCKLEAEKIQLSEQLNKSVQECSDKCSAVDELTDTLARMRSDLADVRAELDAQREADAKKIEELSSAAAAKDRELDANTGTIARLMTDLKAEADARGRADAALAAARRHADLERDAARATEQALRDANARLDAAAKDKDHELSQQMTIILDMRSEKERLQEQIQGMQNTIDNIQKELTGRLPAPKGGSDVGEPPELDAGPQQGDATLYTFLSDGSVDGDALDPREVGRRFAALSRGGSLHAPRRVRAAQGSISLSQVKDDMKIKSRTFFKNKRFDGKSKKLN